MPTIVLVVKGLGKGQSERLCVRTRSFWVIDERPEEVIAMVSAALEMLGAA
jgi:hypothetical protein